MVDPWPGSERMVLHLVFTSNDRAVAIRDHVLPLVREHGALEIQHCAVRLKTWEFDTWMFRHWTPFSDLTVEEASSPGYRHALERQRGRRDLPYGLEIWRGPKMLSILWEDHGAVEVACFVRGAWEDDALAL